MKLHNFAIEQTDNSQVWKDLFSKNDIVFLDDVDLEEFKRDLAKYLFELRYGKQNLLDDIEIGCEEEFGSSYGDSYKALVDFLGKSNRLPFDVCNPDLFIDSFEHYLSENNPHGLDTRCVCQTTKNILIKIADRLRGSFVKFDPSSDSKKSKDTLEFTQMTSQLGEILAKLTFEQLRGCGELIHTKVVLDNPNMPRHGEDLLAYSFNPYDESKDILYLVEAKSTKGSISPQVHEVKERFSNYLNGIPYYEITRLRENIQQKLGKGAEIPRKRISRLMYQFNRDPNHKQIIASAFFHFPSDYFPREQTFAELGNIAVTKADGTALRMDASRVQVITFRFEDFENTVREIFEKAWTL
jgi:hypothetical protein